MTKFIKQLFQSSNEKQLIQTQKKQEKKHTILSLDPTSAPVITLPKSFQKIIPVWVRPDDWDLVTVWPDGFLDLVTNADSQYEQGNYLTAKEEYFKARFLKTDYG